MPILRYGCEVWAPLALKNLNSSNLLSLCNTADIEQINIKFGKYLLGVHRKTTNLAVSGELGRHPLLIDALYHSLNNWTRICNLSVDSIVKKSYLDSLISNFGKTNSWCSSIYTCLMELDFPNLLENQGGTNKNQVKSIHNYIRIKYENEWVTEINSEKQRKLRTYKLFKERFGIENYILSLNFEDRNKFTKLRTSAHCLHIETGRYTRPPTPVDDRVCPICKNDTIEDEEHFLMKCEAYSDARKQLFENLSELSTFVFLENTETFCVLMNSLNGDHEFSKEVSSFINSCFKKREQIMEGIKTSH